MIEMQDRPQTPAQPMPWDPRPLGGLALVGSYLVVIPLLLVIVSSIVAAVGLPFMLLSDAAGRSPLGEVGIFLCWVGSVAAAIGSCWAFSQLNRRVNITNYLKKCPPGSVYFVGGSGMRRTVGAGRYQFGEQAMFFTTGLGPPLVWPMVVIIILDILLIGVTGCGLGILGIAIALSVYDSSCRTQETISVAAATISKVTCHGALMRMEFAVRPVEMLKAVTLAIPPDHVAFYWQFDRMFPGQLPPAYREALSAIRIAESSVA